MKSHVLYLSLCLVVFQSCKLLLACLLLRYSEIFRLAVGLNRCSLSVDHIRRSYIDSYVTATYNYVMSNTTTITTRRVIFAVAYP